MKKILSFILAAALLCGALSGCNFDKTPDHTAPGIPSIGGQTNTEAEPADVDFSQTEDNMFTDRDFRTEYDGETAVHIQLQGDSASATSDSVQINGAKVTIREEATYVICGSLTDGMLIVDAPDTAKLQLVLDGVEIHSRTSAALYILEADKVFLTLAEGSSNALSNGGSFEAVDDNNIDGAVFSKQDLTCNGTGTLTVTSPAGHGIVCKDDLVFTGGSYKVNSASHGLDVNDSVGLTDASLTIDAGKDGIHCENSEDASKGFIYISGGEVNLEAEGDGIAAGSYMQIAGGAINLLSGGGSANGTKQRSDFFGGFMGGRPGKPGQTQSTAEDESSTSMKGLKAAAGLLISGGSITVNSADDAIHSDASVTINGGEFSLASGDDAIHAEETLTVTAGTIRISESYEGLEALHINVQGGDIKLTASDDGLNAAGGTDQSGFTGGRDGMFGGGGRPGGGGFGGGMSANSKGTIVISGGVLYVNASGDGIDANGTLEITGGHTTVVGPTRGDTATLDYDQSATISGGTFIGTGASGMAQTFSQSQQGVIALSVGNQPAGTQILLCDGDGNALITYEPELDFAILILSCPELVKGESYTVTVGSQSGDFTAN